MAATAWACALEGVYGLEGAAAMLNTVVGFAEELEGARALGALARPERSGRACWRALAWSGRAPSGQCRAWVSPGLVLAVSL
jgi:hypothetical protein